jgi:hypothetical protein
MESNDPYKLSGGVCLGYFGHELSKYNDERV